MSNKKVLIYFPEEKIQPVGGPAGYLWNLRKGLTENSNNSLTIDFYHNSKKTIEDNSKLKNMIPKRILELRRVLTYSNYLKREVDIDKSMFNYDVIHFHSTEDMYLNREFLSEYKGKVILTSHSPCAKFKERIGRLNPLDYKIFKKKIDKLEKVDIYAFERADFIIFPCEEAEEPYYNTWDRYASIRNLEKYRYLPTGIIGCESKIEKNEYREKYNIPDDAFVISYVGRHNIIKGYEDLKKVGKEFLKSNRDVYFLIGGKEEPLRGLDDDHWIEVGWTNDPHSLISASNVFILPNKETYFDLVLLEVMSLGTPVVLSNTGGNKYFKRFQSNAFCYYNSVNEAVEVLKKMKEKPTEDILELGKEIRKIYNDNFTIEIFTKNYLNIISEISK